MIVVRVQFPANVTDQEQFLKKMAATTPKYEGLAGLTRKYYVQTEDGKHAGGIYLWETRAHAENWYNEDWIAYMTKAWGQPPLLEYLDCPIVVDNELHKVVSADAA
ncbi:MAG: YdhR family protein [Proteobacteria bacterium]|nr:YdhR family protein [Pseudomonadota bacterium]